MGTPDLAVLCKISKTMCHPRVNDSLQRSQSLLKYRLNSLGLSLLRIHPTKNCGVKGNGGGEGITKDDIYKGIREGWDILKISFPRAFKHCELIQAPF
jgi:hypothetical protein